LCNQFGLFPIASYLDALGPRVLCDSHNFHIVQSWRARVGVSNRSKALRRQCIVWHYGLPDTRYYTIDARCQMADTCYLLTACSEPLTN